MSTELLDTTGLKCPQPILKIAAKAPDMNNGDILEVVGDCATFERDVKSWCDRLNKTCIAVTDEGSGRIKVQIQF